MTTKLIKKSFSKIDKSYIQLFKHKRRMPTIVGDFSLKEFFENKKKKKNFDEINKNSLNSASVKLDLIISDLQQNNSDIKKQFLEDTVLQSENDELRKRMQALYNRKKTYEKKEEEDLSQNPKKKSHIDSTQEAIKHMLYITKKFAIDKNIVRTKTEQNKKVPPICKYTPNLSYISKHIPAFYFGNHRTIINNMKENDKNENRINLEHVNKSSINIKLSKNFDEKFNSISNINNINNIRYNHNLSMTENYNTNSKNDISNSKINNNIFNINKSFKINKHIMKKPSKIIKNLKNSILIEKIAANLEKEQDKFKKDLSVIKSTTINETKTKNNISKRKIPKFPDEQKGMKYNISVPIFNKMTSREKNRPLINKNINMADYSPNYDAIYPNQYKYFMKNDKIKKKKYKLRKILGSYNTKGEYVLLPSLNKH